MRVADGGEQLVLGVWVEVDEFDELRLVDRGVAEHRADQFTCPLSGGGEVVHPASTPVRDVDATQEAGNHFAQFVQHQLGVVASLGQRVCAHPQQQRLERLAAAVDADVRQRGRREHAANGIERLGPGGLAIDEVGVGGITQNRGAHLIGDLGEQQAVGIEHSVHVAHVTGAEAAVQQRRIAVVAVAPTEAGVVGDVPRALLEVAHQPTPLEDLGEHVRRLLACEVHAAELSDRVVAVLEEHLLVELLGAFETGRGVDRVVAADVQIADELVEEQPAEAFRAPAVTREQRALHHFGQIDESENGTVEIGEVPTEDVFFALREDFGDVDRHDMKA